MKYTIKDYIKIKKEAEKIRQKLSKYDKVTSYHVDDYMLMQHLLRRKNK